MNSHVCCGLVFSLILTKDMYDDHPIPQDAPDLSVLAATNEQALRA